jgi:NADH dehydrogenase
MVDALHREADHHVMGADSPPETPASREGGRAGKASLHRIVVVGGGAGGLELVTYLGNRLGRRGWASVTLMDCARTHIWKPLLHGVAAGSIDP